MKFDHAKAAQAAFMLFLFPVVHQIASPTGLRSDGFLAAVVIGAAAYPIAGYWVSAWQSVGHLFRRALRGMRGQR